MAENLKVGLVIDARLGRAYERTFRSARRSQAHLGTQMRTFRNRSRRSAAATTQLGRQLARSTRQASRHGRALGDATRQHREFGRSVRESERQLWRLHQRQRKSSQTRPGRRSVGLGGLGLLGAGYTASRLFGSSLEREAAEVRLRTVLDPVTAERDLEKALSTRPRVRRR